MLIGFIQKFPILGMVPFGAILYPFGVEAQFAGLVIQAVGLSLMVFKNKLFI